MSEQKQGNWFSRHKVLTVIGALVILGAIGNGISGGNHSKTDASNSNTTVSEPTQSASTDVASETPVAQPTETPVAEPSPTETTASDTTNDTSNNVPAEYTSALESAGTYSDTMHMSKKGIYDQLTSAYGDQFSKAAAQYAVDNVQADWNANALASAETYQSTMHMSPAAIHDQLTSEYGEKFTKAQADYAIAHLSK